MKIAISSTGKGFNSDVDSRFGRCPFYIIIEIENKKIKNEKTIENPAMMQPGGAGIAAAQLIGNEKVEAVITGNMGPNAFSVLQQLGIDVYQGTGIIKDVVQQFIDGKLTKINAPTGPAHFGMGFGPGAGKGMGGGFGQGAGMGRGRGQGQGGFGAGKGGIQ